MSSLGTKVAYIIAALINISLWLWLTYRILLEIDASEGTWIVFMIYLPVSICVAIMGAIIGKDDD